ncbi:efflux RND transporter permease subunit, partial [Oleiphilus sp. HI0043]
VDDAVIVGESIHSQNQAGKYGSEGALAGVYDVYKPILFAVTTTIVAFLPLLFLPGPEGQLMQAIPIIVICILVFSLLESIFILPAHLSRKASTSSDEKKDSLLSKIQKQFSQHLDKLNQGLYQPLLVMALKHKELVIVSFSLMFIIFMVLLSTGWMRVALGVAIDAEVVNASVAFPEGASRKKTEAAVNKMLKAAEDLRIELNESSSPSISEPVILHVYSVIGPTLKISNQENKQNLDHTAQVTLELSDSKT